MGLPQILDGAEKYVWAAGVSLQQYPLGQMLLTPSGGMYRYGEMGATAGVAAKLYQSEVPIADWTAQAVTVAITAGATSFSFHGGGTALFVHQGAHGTLLPRGDREPGG